MNLDLDATWDAIVALTPIYLFFIGLVLLVELFKRLEKKLKKSNAKKPKSKKESLKSHEKKVKTFDKIYNKITMAKVDKMTGEEFEILTEKLIKAVYQDQVIRTEQTTRTGDQGCDLVVHLKNGERLGIQCKRYEGKVGNDPIKEILNAKAFYGLKSCMVVTNSKFTPGGLEAGKRNNVTMVDRDKLQKWIDIYNQRLEKLHSKK